MAHTIEKRWNSARRADGSVQEGVNELVGQACTNVLHAIQAGEELYQQLTEMVAFAGDMQAVADQLFKEQWDMRGETGANATELAMVQDAAAASTALHQLYEAMNNGTVTADDRAGKLRRMI